MRCGLVGKIPAKPDYVAIEASQGLLAAVEPWLHACVSSSCEQLGARWREAYLAAPIWRFWLGAEICGAATLGALMPSIDSEGRYFPLLTFVAEDSGRAILPPEFEAHDVWFKGAEALLLSTLSPGACFGETVAALGRLPATPTAPPVAARAPLAAVRGGVSAPLDDKRPEQIFTWLRRADWGSVYGGRSFWWTAGGADFRPLALAFHLLPDPMLFAAMLTGKFPGDIS